MSKGLEALTRLKLAHGNFMFANEYSDIEKELKEKAKFDAFMKCYNIDNVEELDTFFNEHLNNDIDKCSKCKELKALEIIKIKKVNVWSLYTSFRTKELWAYNNGTTIREYKLTQEEYDLLKEVML